MPSHSHRLINVTCRQGDATLLSIRSARHEGTCEVSGAGMLVATIDNSQSMFSGLGVACQLTVQPLHQLQALEEHRERVELRKQLAQNDAALAEQARDGDGDGNGNSLAGVRSLAYRLTIPFRFQFHRRG